jgi:MFS transporter, SP family, galactose:H+ symporter
MVGDVRSCVNSPEILNFFSNTPSGCLSADMLGLAGIPAILQLFGMIFFVTESPRWLYARGRVSEARDILRRIRKYSAETEKEIDEIKDSLREESGGWRDLLAPEIRPALMVGMALQAFQQFVGINTAMYYSATILQSAGIGDGSDEDAIWYSCGVAVMNALGTILSLFLIDRVGRRPLLLTTLVPTAAGLVALGFSFWTGLPAGWQGPLALGSLLLYIAGFAVGMGPVPWAVNSEIYPLRVRAICASAATTVNWITNLIVSITFLSYGNAVTKAGAFWTYACVCGVCFVFVFFLMPETKGKSMEEIQALFRKQKSYGAVDTAYRVQTDEKIEPSE